MTAPYVYVWEFIVFADHASAFEHTYGASGEWVQLFRRGSGYLRSELYRDRSRPERFITIDYWESKEDWDAFRTRFAEEFERLDARCAAWTRSEVEIGRFEPIPEAAP
jgi:heme-degrading monooxygenase HmoA